MGARTCCTAVLVYLCATFAIDVAAFCLAVILLYSVAETDAPDASYPLNYLYCMVFTTYIRRPRASRVWNDQIN